MVVFMTCSIFDSEREHMGQVSAHGCFNKYGCFLQCNFLFGFDLTGFFWNGEKFKKS